MEACRRPALSIFPPELPSTLHVTAVLLVPVTLAVKACVASRNTVTELGATVTLMSERAGEGEAKTLSPHRIPKRQSPWQ